MDRVLSAVKCGECRQELVSPVILPCNHSICRKHLATNAKKITCSRCGLQHKTANFPNNEALAEIIAARVPSIDFGNIHKESKDRCNQLESLIKHMDVLLKDPYAYTCEEINQLKSQVRAKSEQLKQRINQETTMLLTSLDEYQNQCKNTLTKPMNSVEKEKYKSVRMRCSSSLASWKNELNEIKFDERKWREITRDCKQAIRELEENIYLFKEELLLRDIEYYRSEVERFQTINLKSSKLPGKSHLFS